MTKLHASIKPADTGGLGSPGQKIIQHETTAEQLKRIQKTIMWMLLYSLVIIGLTFFDLVLWGPMMGVVLGAAGIVAVIYRRILPAMHERMGRGQVAALTLAVLALSLWGWLGHELLITIWPPWRVSLPLYAKALIEAVTLVVRVAAGWGVWGMWSELVDPYGPTPPRAAVNRDKTIKPWDPETHGGTQGQPEPAARVMYLPTIVTEKSSNGHSRTENRIMLRAPSARPDGLYQYAAGLAAGRAFPSWEGGRSGPGAQQYGYNQIEFEDWRRSAEHAGLINRRPGKNQGYEITERGQFHFGRIGERALQAAAFTIHD